MNSGNLKLNSERTPEERKKLATKAGKASGKARQKKKMIQEALMRALKGKYIVDNNQLDGYDAIAVKMVYEALNGNVQAFKEIRDTIGERPKETLELESEQITGIKIKFVDKSNRSNRKEKDPKIVGDYTPPTNTEEK